MAVSRADTLTGSRKYKDFFSDFLNNFDKSPYGNDIGRVVDNKAVEQSLRNLIKTNIGERLFQPNIGSNIYAMLFEQNTTDTLDAVEFYIQTTINNNEPRVQLQKVVVEPDQNNQNAVNIFIIYNLINNPETITLNMLLKRVR
jgi:phage baseplate assembly protein W